MGVHPGVVGGQVHDVTAPGQVRHVDTALLGGLSGDNSGLVSLGLSYTARYSEQNAVLLRDLAG